MAQAKKLQIKVGGQKEYTVIKMTCENCGEDVYYVFACHHCGEYLSFSEAKPMTKEEIKTLMEEEGKEVKGDIKPILATGDEFDDVDSDVGSLEVEEVDDLYSGPFNPL
jgi:predicted ATP-dependent serine protease